jgi:PAS domain S-box-containing protein
LSENLRKTGLDVVGDIPWGSHLCQFYYTAQDLIDILVPYFSEGIKNNEFCMWVTSEPLGVEAAQTAMAAALSDFQKYVERGQIEIIAHTDWYLKSGAFDSVRVLRDWISKHNKALADGYDGLRLTGNTFWLEPERWNEFTNYEAAINAAIGRYRMLAVCTYSLNRCGITEVLDVIRNHHSAIIRRDGHWELIENTEHKRAQDEMNRLAHFPEENPNPVLRVTRGCELMYANSPARTLLESMGWKKNSPIPKSLRELAGKAEGEGGVVEEELMDSRGRTYWFSAVRPGKEPYVNLYARNITQRKNAEAALRESSERLKHSQEIAHLGSWELDLTENQLVWSDEVYRIFGLKPKEFGATYESFLDAVHPEDRDLVDGAYAESVREGRDSYEIEHRIRRRDNGEVRTVHEKCTHVRDASGRIVRSVGMIHDITERKKTEALHQALLDQERVRLGAAVEQASDAIIMVDLDGTIQYVNQAFESINRVSRDKAIGLSYIDLLEGSPAADAVSKSVSQGRAWSGQLIRSISGERPVELEVMFSPIKNPTDKYICGLVTERDVTQTNALLRQGRHTQKMEALGTLAGGIAHDFNNILGTVVINTELALLDLEPSNPAQKPLPLILEAANRGKELVKQIITFTRQREKERIPLKIVDVIEEGMKFLQSTLSKDIVIHKNIHDGNSIVLADPSQIHQILINLCQNAALAMRDHGGNLEVKLEPVQVDEAMVARHPDLKPGAYVHLMVADSGCGMSQDLIERIFEPFFTTREKGEGSGLGLAVVHGIVKSYEGAITIYSEPGRGSVFNVYIPQAEEKTPAAKIEVPAGLQKGKESILYVEDEDVQLKSMTHLLHRLGYRVTAKSNASAALTAFKKSPDSFDLVITDQTMPGMTGIELARAIANIRAEIPIILCTGFSEKINGEMVGRDGIRAIVMKPFTLQKISKQIRRALKKQEVEE